MTAVSTVEGFEEERFPHGPGRLLGIRGSRRDLHEHRRGYPQAPTAPDEIAERADRLAPQAGQVDEERAVKDRQGITPGGAVVR